MGRPMNSPSPSSSSSSGNRYYSTEDRAYFIAGPWRHGRFRMDGEERERTAAIRKNTRDSRDAPRESECRPVISGIYRRGCNHKSCSIE